MQFFIINIVWVFLVSVPLKHAVGQYNCPQECVCSQQIVQCIQTHISTIPKFSDDVSSINLRLNRLHGIPSNAFNYLKKLHTLRLSENEISNVKKDAFLGLSTLRVLYLNNNRLRKISNELFNGLNNLEELYLENNEIHDIETMTFNSLPRLKRLFLSGNKITTFPMGLFDNLINLRRLRLDNNPIKCDCAVGSLLKMHQNMRTHVTLTCDAPKALHQVSFSALVDQDFHCTKPQMVEEPHDMVALTGETVELSCAVTGNPEPHVAWLHDTNEITDFSRMQVLRTGALRIPSVESNDVGVYECIGRNEVGIAKSKPVKMVVNNNRNAFNVQPQFINRPKDIAISLNEFAILDCTASGSPVPEIKWFFKGRLISQSTETKRTLSNGSLEITGATLQDAGVYRCEATNQFKSIQTEAVVDVKELPLFISVPESQTVKIGETILMECDAEGNPLPTISWTFNDEVLNDNNRVTLTSENTELIIKDAQALDSGIYKCIAKNKDGESEAQAIITVEDSDSPPSLIFGPYDLDAISGTTIELPCKGDDSSAHVKWQKDGRLITKNERIEISGSGSLYIKNAILSDTGRYECSIKNKHGRSTAAGLVTIRSNDILAPGDKYVRVAFAEAAGEIDLAINNTIKGLFSKRAHDNPLHHSELLRIFRFPKGEARQLARAAEIYERTLVNIRKQVQDGYNLSITSDQYEFKDLLSREHLRLVAELSGCMEHREMPNCTDMCYHSKYRSVDGTCNNLNNPIWGASLTAFRRIEKPIYENGFSMPIGWTKDRLYSGFSKPSSRLVSTKLITTQQITPDDRISHMVMQWGQFLDHDLDHAIPSVSSESWDGVDCKKTCEFAPPCYPIEVPPKDPRVKNRRCIDLIRSSAICGSGMTSIFFDSVQQREQINQLTSYIDASQVYGYTFEFAQELRNFTTDDGLLRTGVHFPGQKDMLPFAAPQDGVDCRRNLDENSMNCFVAGDIRANEQVGLLAMHTIWMREHNRVALKLKEINPHWDGDTVYQEARKIVGATMQHITFKHWLPLIIGTNGMQKLGEYKGYDHTIDPSIVNEFATAAFRFGHTLINPILHRLNESYQPISQGHLPLHKAFFAPWRIAYEGGVDPLMRGFFTVPAKLKMPTQNLNAELTEKLFLTSHAVALDLAAINIQRGRDHGIAGYNVYRKFCNLSVAASFDDLSTEISSVEVRQKLEELYGNPDNIDLFVGGILEDPVVDGKVGPVFQCILVEQFKKLRDGDRFYYESPTVFLPEQLQQIKQTSLARVLCDNGDKIDEITENVFLIPNMQGGYKNCIDITGINLYFWQDCGTCDSMPALLKTYVPETYPKRKKRSVSSLSYTNKEHGDAQFEQYRELTDKRISNLENLLIDTQQDYRELKKLLNSNGSRYFKNGKFMNSNKTTLCTDEFGITHSNNETWEQDVDTHCRCEFAQIICTQKICDSHA